MFFLIGIPVSLRSRALGTIVSSWPRINSWSSPSAVPGRTPTVPHPVFDRPTLLGWPTVLQEKDSME